MSVTEQNLGQLFWAAAQSEPLPAAKPEAKSSCCGSRPAAKTAAEATAETGTAPAAKPAKASCCGPRPAAETEAAPAAKSSCCG
ncbi:hypothetical protein [Streptosporangium sp. CA-115845]|uniref:hypothetical protein n=1 Tax=Streptosporangium sp. CA-115845 TaxID=3240071 RepID=UPI003D8CED09